MSPSSDEPRTGATVLSVIVPVYQEELNIDAFLNRIEPVLDGITPGYEIIFCMDPGRDKTEEVIRRAIKRNPRVRLIMMSRRWGQDACMIAGLEVCHGRAAIIIDVDLQDPPEVIAQLVTTWREGYDVVYAQRRTRQGDTATRKLVAYIGYRFINHISEVAIPRDTGDFRLVDRKVIEGLRGLKETHGFLRGLVPYVGYRQTSVLYDRSPRHAGASNYGAIFGSIRHGVNGIVAFSQKPIAWLSLAGGVLFVAGVLLAVVCLVTHVLHLDMCRNVTLTSVLVLVVGGLQLLGLGLLGEYIGRTYEEARQRPKYMIASKVNFDAT